MTITTRRPFLTRIQSALTSIHSEKWFANYSISVRLFLTVRDQMFTLFKRIQKKSRNANWLSLKQLKQTQGIPESQLLFSILRFTVKSAAKWKLTRGRSLFSVRWAQVIIILVGFDLIRQENFRWKNAENFLFVIFDQSWFFPRNSLRLKYVQKEIRNRMICTQQRTASKIGIFNLALIEYQRL
jgi:hypothetical protein